MKNFPLDETPFNLELSVSCGQAFRWRKFGDAWYAPSPYGEKSVWKILQKDDVLYYEGFTEDELIRYFALDQNLEKILNEMDRDELIHEAIVRCRGLRIFRQEPWECLISYICSSCSNIPGISMRIENLSEKYGEKIFFEEKKFHTFPTPEKIFEADVCDVRLCKVGYRDKYICGAAEMAVSFPNWSKNIFSLEYFDARKKLCELSGVGKKVADCVLLFAFEKFEAVPVDVWIERIFRMHYFGGEKKLKYDDAGNFAREHFGEFAGYAQEYLFAEREVIGKKGK